MVNSSLMLLELPKTGIATVSEGMREKTREGIHTGDGVILGRIDPGDGDLDPALAKVEILRQGLAGYIRVRQVPRQNALLNSRAPCPRTASPSLLMTAGASEASLSTYQSALSLPPTSPSPTYQVMLTFCPGVHTVVAFGDKMCGT